MNTIIARFRNILDFFLNIWHMRRTYKLKRGKDRNYRNYLNIQLRRTLSKRDKKPELRAELLTDLLLSSGSISTNASVLCIGPRNNYEIERLYEKGFSSVVGIDLYSDFPQILVMDMHNMKFMDNTFDAIYSSHSLEHAYDVSEVVSEIVRVAREGALMVCEVPIKFGARGADLIDFGCAQNLIRTFQPHVNKVLYCQNLPPNSDLNPLNICIARVAFTIRKHFPESASPVM